MISNPSHQSLFTSHKKGPGAGHKPGPVTLSARRRAERDHSSSPAVTGGIKRPTREHRTGSPQTLSYSVLLRVGFAWLPVSPPGPVSSYLAVSPLPPTQSAGGGLLSVALSSSSPRLGVTQHPALRSPDFPPATSLDGRRSLALLRDTLFARSANLPLVFIILADFSLYSNVHSVCQDL